MVVNKIILHNMIRARETPPPHGKCHFKIPFFGRLPLGRPSSGIVCPFFVFMPVQFDLISAIMSNLKPSEKDI